MYSQKSRIAKHFEIFESVSIHLKQSSEKNIEDPVIKTIDFFSAVLKTAFSFFNSIALFNNDLDI